MNVIPLSHLKEESFMPPFISNYSTSYLLLIKINYICSPNKINNGKKTKI